MIDGSEKRILNFRQVWLIHGYQQEMLPEKRKLLSGRGPQSEIGFLSGVLRQREGKPLCFQLKPFISCYFRHSKICIS